MFSLLGIPTVISAALNFAAPILAGVVKFFSWYLAEMWDGLKTIASNLSTLIVIATVAGIAVTYGSSLGQCEEGSVFSEKPITKPWRHDFGIR